MNIVDKLFFGYVAFTSCMSIIISVANVLGQIPDLTVFHSHNTEHLEYLFLRNLAKVINTIIVFQIWFIASAIVCINWVENVLHPIWLKLIRPLDAIIDIAHKNQMGVEK